MKGVRKKGNETYGLKSNKRELSFLSKGNNYAIIT